MFRFALTSSSSSPSLASPGPGNNVVSARRKGRARIETVARFRESDELSSEACVCRFFTSLGTRRPARTGRPRPHRPSPPPRCSNPRYLSLTPGMVYCFPLPYLTVQLVCLTISCACFFQEAGSDAEDEPGSHREEAKEPGRAKEDTKQREVKQPARRRLDVIPFSDPAHDVDEQSPMENEPGAFCLLVHRF